MAWQIDPPLPSSEISTRPKASPRRVVFDDRRERRAVAICQSRVNVSSSTPSTPCKPWGRMAQVDLENVPILYLQPGFLADLAVPSLLFFE